MPRLSEISFAKVRGVRGLPGAILVGLLHGLACPAGTPRVGLSPRQHDFGSLYNPAQVTGRFVVTNSGDAPLTIRDLIPDCDSCTQASASTNRLDAGESTVLTVTLDLRDFSGPVRRGLAVVTDDPVSPVLRVELQGEAQPAFELTTRSVLLRTRPVRESLTVGIRPLSRLGAPLSRVKADNPHVIASLEAGGRGWVSLVLRPGPEPPPGLTRFSVEVSTGDPADPVCRVMGAVFEAGDLEVFPSRLFFPASAEPVVRLLQVRQYASPGLRLTGLTSSIPELHWDVVAERNGLDYRLQVSRWPTTQPSPAEGTLSLLLADHAGRPQRKEVPILLGAVEPSSPPPPDPRILHP